MSHISIALPVNDGVGANLVFARRRLAWIFFMNRADTLENSATQNYFFCEDGSKIYYGRIQDSPLHLPYYWTHRGPPLQRTNTP